MTPFLAATTPAQARVNTTNCKTRCATGSMQHNTCVYCLACVVLHNTATRCNVPLRDDVYDAPEPVEEPHQPLAFCQNEGLTGRVVRDAIVRNYF